jgi:hypothetical protein
MNISENHKLELIDLTKRYKSLRELMVDLQERADDLSKAQKEISEKLIETRRYEQTLINNIEKDLGRKISQEDLLKILNGVE